MPLRGDFGSGPAEVFPERFRYYPRVSKHSRGGDACSGEIGDT